MPINRAKDGLSVSSAHAGTRAWNQKMLATKTGRKKRLMIQPHNTKNGNNKSSPGEESFNPVETGLAALRDHPNQAQPDIRDANVGILIAPVSRTAMPCGIIPSAAADDPV